MNGQKNINQKLIHNGATKITTVINSYTIKYRDRTVVIYHKNETAVYTGAHGFAESKDEYSYTDKDLATLEQENATGVTTTSNSLKVSNDESKVLYFINYARLFLNSRAADQYIAQKIAYLIIYVALVTFTVVFTFRYIKRVIYVAFLTLIAPMVALTYPIDKIKDRKSSSMEYVV